MAFHGDLSSYPLPELLQWLDTSRKTGALSLQWQAGSRKIFVLLGQVVGTATPGLWERLARVLDHGNEASGQRVMESLRGALRLEPTVDMALRQLAEDELIAAIGDITQTPQATFHWTEDPDRGGDEWISTEISLRQVLFDALRRLDESVDVERVLPHDTLVVKAVGSPPPIITLHRVILHVANKDAGVSLGRLWLQLGLAKSVVLRAVYDLLRSGHVVVEGALQIDADPISDMLEKGAVLIRERQFDAAGLVFSALLQNDPGDRRVRAFAQMAEREHAAALYRELPPVTTFHVTQQLSALAQLRPEERRVLDQLSAGWDVSAVVLASGQREVDALRLIQKLVRLGLAQQTGQQG